jgi:hypothetical protein
MSRIQVKDHLYIVCQGLLWCLKQLLPLTYRCEYIEGADEDGGVTKGGKKVFTVWNMWFGKVFNQDAYYVTGKCS